MIKKIIGFILKMRRVPVKSGEDVLSYFYLPEGKKFKTYSDLRKDKVIREVEYV